MGRGFPRLILPGHFIETIHLPRLLSFLLLLLSYLRSHRGATLEILEAST